MFPAPIQKATPPKRYLYYAAVVVALVAWLLPLLAVLLTSIRSAEDLNMGNYWGWPKEWKFANYIEIFQETPLTRYLCRYCVRPSQLWPYCFSRSFGTIISGRWSWCKAIP